MRLHTLPVCLTLTVLALFGFTPASAGLTAEEIIDKAFQPKVSDSFRAALHIKAVKKGKKQPDKLLWVMGKIKDEKSRLFFDFEEPEESKGIRFLVIMRGNDQPTAFMYMPAANRTLPIDVEEGSTDLAGTGLTVGDIRMFARRPLGKPKLVGEEKVRDRECYVLEADLEGTTEKRRIWITKDQFILVQARTVDKNGNPLRTFEVVEFFEGKEGKIFPREELILVPEKHIKIRVRQEHAVFGIEIPEEVLNPETFGEYRWRIQ